MNNHLSPYSAKKSGRKPKIEYLWLFRGTIYMLMNEPKLHSTNEISKIIRIRTNERNFCWPFSRENYIEARAHDRFGRLLLNFVTLQNVFSVRSAKTLGTSNHICGLTLLPTSISSSRYFRTKKTLRCGVQIDRCLLVRCSSMECFIKTR